MAKIQIEACLRSESDMSGQCIRRMGLTAGLVIQSSPGLRAPRSTKRTLQIKDIQITPKVR